MKTTWQTSRFDSCVVSVNCKKTSSIGGETWHRAVINNYPLFYLWPHMRKMFLTVSIRTAEHTVTEWIRKGSTNCSKQIHWMAQWLNKVFEQMRLNSRGKFFNWWGPMTACSGKIFKWMRLNGWMAEENFWMDKVKRLREIFEWQNSWMATVCLEWLADVKGWMSEYQKLANEITSITMNNSKVKLWFLSEN